MCGIFGYIGKKNCESQLIRGLGLLEYRGYDSAGLTILNAKKFFTLKTIGKVKQLKDKLIESKYSGSIGIAHTRWATHGKPNEVNCHPHFGNQRKIAIVHNGIIENYKELKAILQKKGCQFLSETDTEVLAMLIEENVKEKGFLEGVREALLHVRGTFAVAVLNIEQPDTMLVCKNKSPLVIGVGDKEYYVSSDVIPLLEHTKRVVYLKDNEIGEIKDGSLKIYDIQGKVQAIKIEECNLNPMQVALDGFAHFMQKEIFEQSSAVENLLLGRISSTYDDISLEENVLSIEKVKKISRIIIVGCGTAWHAGLIGRNMIERIANIPVQVEYASEFRYREPIVDNTCLVIAISQSGETADTLGAVSVAKENGAYTLGIVNAVGSTLTREADEIIYTRAGPEIGVASTKAFSTQIVALYLVAVHLGKLRGSLFGEELKRRVGHMQKLAPAIRETLMCNDVIKKIAEKYLNAPNVIFMGRGTGFAVALEGALKLKEISYVHAEGLHAAELKHGPIALIDDSMPVVVIALKGRRLDKIQSNMSEVKARGGKLIAIVSKGDEQIKHDADEVVEIPDDVGILNSILATIPLQLLAYYFALLRGCNVDQPRNLAKSVTVE